jgi:prophage regulatory protein
MTFTFNDMPETANPLIREIRALRERIENMEGKDGQQADGLYRIVEIIGDKKKGISGIIPMGRTAWYRGIKEGRYPKPVKLSVRSVAWTSKDISDLISRLSAGRWSDRQENN